MVDRVERRLAPWWRAEGEASAQARIRGVLAGPRRAHITEALTRMAAFLESTPPSHDAYIHAIAPPEPKSENYTATAILNHLPIEAAEAASDPDSIAEVAVHELTHYLYDYIPRDKHVALAGEFAGSGAPSVLGIYSYLHEAIAVSAQGIYRDTLARGGASSDDAGDGEYKHPYIPTLAKVALPIARASVAQHTHLVGGGFSRPYIDGVVSALGSRRTDLPFVFAQAIIITPPDHREWADAFEGTVFPVGSVELTDAGKAQAVPDTNLVELSTYDALDVTRDRQLATVRAARRGFAWASRRGRVGYHLVIAGRTGDDVLAVLKALSDVDAVSGPGLITSVD